MDYICNDCPRQCNILRTDSKGSGFCKSPYLPVIARAAPHFGEEPCISGTKGSGAIFFSGCNLACKFCQNGEISHKLKGKQVDLNALVEIMLSLQDMGVHNINLVTPTHYSRVIAEALRKARLKIPVVWNSSGYEKIETLKLLDGLVDIYMPDFKYYDSTIAQDLSQCPNYAKYAKDALSEMFRQVGKYKYNNNGMLYRGVLVRHLILPGEVENSMNVIDFIADTYKDNVLFSLMSQYTPLGNPGEKYMRRISDEENEMLIHYMKFRQLTGFCQDITSATSDLIPEFNYTGVK